MLEVACNGCGRKYRAPEQFAGKKMRCKQCGDTMVVPETAEVPVDAPVEHVEVPRQAESAKDLEETAVLDAEAREELERTRPKARKQLGKKRPDIGSKRISERAGARKGIGARAPRRSSLARGRQRVEGDGGAQGGSKQRLIVVVAASAILVLAVLVVAYVKFFSKGDESPEPMGTASVTSTESSKTPTAEPESEGSLPEGRLDRLTLIPGDVDMLASLNPKRFKALAEILPSPEAPGAAEESEKDFVEDLLDKTERVLIGFRIPEETGELLAPEPSPEVLAAVKPVLVAEGSFGDASKVLEALQDAGYLDETPKEYGRLRAYAMTEEGTKKGLASATEKLPMGIPGAPPGLPAGDGGGLSETGEPEGVGLLFAFVTQRQIVVAPEQVFPEIADLAEGKGESASTSSRLLALAEDFAYNPALRLGVVMTAQLEEHLGDARDFFEQMNIPFPEIESASFLVDSPEGEGGLNLNLKLNCPSEEEAKKGQQAVLTLRTTLGMSLLQTEEQREYLKKLIPVAEGKRVEVSFALSAEELEQLLEAALAPPGAPPDGGELELPGLEIEGGEPEDEGMEAQDDELEKELEALEEKLREELGENDKAESEGGKSP